MNEFLVETQFSRAIYEADGFEILEGGTLHLYTKGENGQIITEYLFSPPYDVHKNPS